VNALPVAPIAADPATAFRSVARSHVGRVRSINEDRVFDCPEAGIWAVADGMGGHRGGDLAAQAVVERLRALTASRRVADFTDMLVALGQANADIRHRNDTNGFDAGTTVVAALIDGATAHIAWAGDSRAYRIRDGGLQLLTHDHSLVQELIDAGLLTPAAAERHPQSNVVTRALGICDDPGLQMTSAPLAPGDRLLLCSDGLSRSFQPDDAVDGDTEQLCDRLLGNALRRDGTDNVSLVVVEIADR
jgi:serine/threonine protein phosphatase PrpC